MSLSTSASRVGPGGALTLTATASDAGGVAKVEFFDGSTRLGEDTAAPYTLDVDTAAADGEHAYHARATDAAGNAADSSEVVVAFDRAGPGVALAGSAPLLRPVDTLVLTATATDPAGVARVEFLAGKTTLGEATAAPYTLSLPLADAADGVHVFTARATDALGNVTTSASLEVRVDGTAPQVALEAPPPFVPASGTLLLTAQATDASGIARVEFYEGATMLAEDATAPFALDVSLTGKTGSYVYTARAYDAAGNAGASEAVQVTVDATAPAVSLAPLPTYVRADGTLTLSATASDDLAVARVEFYEGSTRIGEDTSEPYALDVSMAGKTHGATYGYQARVFDTAGNGADSGVRQVIVDGVAPTVSLGSLPPAVKPGTTLTLQATAGDTSGITRVEFFDGATLLGEDTSAPYALPVSLAGMADGAHVYTARASDAAGNTTTSAGRTVAVDGTPPTVGLTSSSTSVTSAGPVTLTASATDVNGILRVEFYDGATKRGEDATAPYTLALSFGAADSGTHRYTARAVDAAGNAGTSAALDVVVDIPDTTPPSVALSASALAFTRDDSLTLTASGTDDVGLTRVDLFENDTLLTTLSGPGTHAVPMRFPKNGTLRYSARAYDAAGNTATSSELTVDVAISWTRQFGTNWLDTGDVLALDAQGHVFVGGDTHQSMDGQAYAGGWDVFVSKFDIASTERLWTRMTGTTGYESPTALATGADGSVYVAGETSGPLEGELAFGSSDAFVSRYDADGRRLWTRQWGTTASDSASGLVVDADGVVVVGTIDSSTPTYGTDSDMFLRRYALDGTLLWSKTAGTRGQETVFGAAAGADGTLYVVGRTHGTFPGQTSMGSGDIFVARFDKDGNALGTQQFGTSSSERPSDIAVDAAGNVYVTGATSGAFAGAVNAGGEDAFVAMLEPSGVLRTRQWGSTGTDIGQGVGVDASGAIYVAADVAGSIDGTTHLGGTDAYLVKFSSSLASREWSRQWGSADYDRATALVVSGEDIYVAGTTNGALDGQARVGSSDAYVRRLRPDGSHL